VYTSANLGIMPAPLTVVANSQTKIYGDVDPALTFAASGFRFSDTAVGVLTGGLSRAAGETVAGGPYAITKGTLAANANYSIVYTSANLGITPAPLTVGANGQTKIYGDADPALTFIANGFKFSDTLGTVLTGGLSRTAGETVAGGPYAITQGSLAANANYSIVYTGANLGITPAPLTVVADARTKVYGDADPALTFAATGFRFSDTAASVLAGSLARAPGESVAGGPYAITQGSLTANANYAMVYTGAALTITPAPLTVIAAAQAKVYGDADPALTFSASGFKFGDGPGTVLSGGLSRSVGESVAGGPYAITLGTLAAGANYTIVYAGAHLAVTPRPITIAADDQAKTAQSPDPAFTWSLRTGRIVVGDTPTGGLSRAVGEAAGTYAITQGSFTYGPNYSLTFVDGAFTIAPQPTQPPRGIATAGMTTPGVPSGTVTAHPLQPAPLDIFATDAQDGGCAVNGQGTLICP
ncbi:MAG TPA: MBG domain-containing protein, partial [Vineibacter sp.]|nr:MBG domain-containing protein [Vineibacter sp.]